MITREADYAIRAVLELASRDAGCSAAELARATQVPYPFLRRVLQKLTAARLVATRRGRTGGVRLARASAAISLLDVARAIDPATITLNSCLRDGGACARRTCCTAQTALVRIQRDLWRALADVSFDTLAPRTIDHTHTTKPRRTK